MELKFGHRIHYFYLIIIIALIKNLQTGQDFVFKTIIPQTKLYRNKIIRVDFINQTI